MTAIGILAGSGIMRIDLTLLAAILGAIGGDSLSYSLGYIYRDRLPNMWPFKNILIGFYTEKIFLLAMAEKSVLIGRFVGPLRSIIPVIAGMMHMTHWRFLIANIISAIGWALLYVMPGVLIGAAGSELSTENATQLFLIILLLLIGIWLLGLLLKWLLVKIHSFTKRNLHRLWQKMENKPGLSVLYQLITPPYEHEYYRSAGLFLLTIFSLLASGLLIINDQAVSTIDLPTHLFLQSIHTTLLEFIFIACSQLISTTTLTGLYLLCCLWCFTHHNTRTAFYLSSLFISSELAALLINYFYASPETLEIAFTEVNSIVASNLMLATAFYGFILFFINTEYSLITTTLRTFILIILGVSGFSALYLGNYWFSDVLNAYALGLFICLVHCLIYRRTQQHEEQKKKQSASIFISLFFSIITLTAISTWTNFKSLVETHAEHHKKIPYFRRNMVDTTRALLYRFII